jgi:ABC-type branched-subunit amino acid transport system substrate-binding protein
MNSRMLAALALAAAMLSPMARAENAPGVTDTEIKIGQTMPYSGPLSAWGTVGKTEALYFKMINDEGGINGRKIVLVSVDDGYSPPKSVEQVRRLVEQDRVAFIFNGVGVASNLAVRKYLNQNKVPQLFAFAPSEAFNDPKHYPWSIPYLPSLYMSGRMAARYFLKHAPNGKIAIIYQNDESGREHLRGLKEGLGDRAGAIVKAVSYELSDPTVDTQIVTLQASGADNFYNAAALKFASQSIRKAAEIGWKPLQFLSYTSSSVAAVLKPAGLDNAKGIVSAAVAKDFMDPQWQDDPATKDYRAWIANYDPKADPADGFVAAGYSSPMILVQVLKQCGNDLSRENIIRQATNLHHLVLPWMLPGIEFDNSPTDYQGIKTMRFLRFNGERWVLLSGDEG